MPSHAKSLARKIFYQYREPSATLAVGYKDEEDILLDRLERDIDKLSHSGSLGTTSGESLRVRPNDILVRDSVYRLSIDGLDVEIS